MGSYCIEGIHSGAIEGTCAGCLCSHVDPFQIHVSLAAACPPFPLLSWGAPPNRTTSCRDASYAMRASWRGAGLVAGCRCVQPFPSHVQVSLSTFVPLPPNTTIAP